MNKLLEDTYQYHIQRTARKAKTYMTITHEDLRNDLPISVSARAYVQYCNIYHNALVKSSSYMFTFYFSDNELTYAQDAQDKQYSEATNYEHTDKLKHALQSLIK